MNPLQTTDQQDRSAQELQRQQFYIQEGKAHVTELAQKMGRPLTFAVTTFGCQMNARDSEKLTGILLSMGYVQANSEKADFVIFNTCTVRDNANSRVFGRLGILNGYKAQNPHMKIAMCGCMMQEPQVVAKIRQSYPFVDLIFGTHNLYQFAELYVRMLQEKKVVSVLFDQKENDRPMVENLPTSRKLPFKTGINIMYGCDNFCSYCIVPYVRGRERSRDPQDILSEIRKAAAEGVVEVMLLGQNVNSYHPTSTASSMTFAQLLEEIEQIDGISRIRFMTSHPKDLSDDLIRVMRHSNKICRHLHLPLQSGSTRILNAMNRRYTKEQYIDLALRIRSEIPHIALSTDLMIGFPGETAQDVDDTIDVVRKVRFENAFTFLYSVRANTPAASMPQVLPEVAKAEFRRVLDVVQEVAHEQAALLEGTVQEVLIEEVNPKNPALLTGRLSNNMTVHFPWKDSPQSQIGTLTSVKLTQCCGFYYIGDIFPM
jgi:tRNA-2-methylthio-N6-dimethylallyladenosine synthase